MATCGYVGRPDVQNPTLLHLRLVQFDASPKHLMPTIVAIQDTTFGGDTGATVTALLACIWAYLGVDVTTTDTFLGVDTPIAGVGMAIDATPTDPPIVVPIDQVGALPGQWIYLLDPAANTLTVLPTADPATPATTYTLTGTAGVGEQR